MLSFNSEPCIMRKYRALFRQWAKYIYLLVPFFYLKLSPLYKERNVWLEVPAEITEDSIATYMINDILLTDKIAKPVSFKPDVKYKEEFEDIYETYGDF